MNHKDFNNKIITFEDFINFQIKILKIKLIKR